MTDELTADSSLIPRPNFSPAAEPGVGTNTESQAFFQSKAAEEKWFSVELDDFDFKISPTLLEIMTVASYCETKQKKKARDEVLNSSISEFKWFYSLAPSAFQLFIVKITVITQKDI